MYQVAAHFSDKEVRDIEFRVARLKSRAQASTVGVGVVEGIAKEFRPSAANGLTTICRGFITIFLNMLRIVWTLSQDKWHTNQASKKALLFTNLCERTADNIEMIKSFAIHFDESSTSMDAIMKKWNDNVVSTGITSSFPFNILAPRISSTMLDIIEKSEDTAETLALSTNDNFLGLVMKEIDGLSKN